MSSKLDGRFDRNGRFRTGLLGAVRPALLGLLAGLMAMGGLVPGCASGPPPVPLLGPPSPLTGEVFGSIRSGIDPIEGAAVSLAGSGLSTTTNGAGSFLLASVPPGTYLLNARAAGFADAARDVTVRAARLSGGDLELQRLVDGGSLGGRVTDGLVPVTGARVEVLGSTAVAETGDGGRFLLTAIGAGLYQLRITRPGFRETEVDARVADGLPTEVEVSLPRRSDGVLTGRVTDGVRGIATCDRPAAVLLFRPDGTRLETVAPPVAECATSRGVFPVNDRFRFEGLATGPHILQAGANGFRTGTKVLQVIGGAENDGDIVLTLDGATAAVTGVVLDETLLPVRDVNVELSAGSTQRTTTSGEDGRYLLAGLQPGPASLAFTAPTFTTRLLSIALSAGDTSDGTVVLRR